MMFFFFFFLHHHHKAYRFFLRSHCKFKTGPFKCYPRLRLDSKVFPYWPTSVHPITRRADCNRPVRGFRWVASPKSFKDSAHHISKIHIYSSSTSPTTVRSKPPARRNMFQIHAFDATKVEWRFIALNEPTISGSDESKQRPKEALKCDGCVRRLLTSQNDQIGN